MDRVKLNEIRKRLICLKVFYKNNCDKMNHTPEQIILENKIIDERIEDIDAQLRGEVASDTSCSQINL